MKEPQEITLNTCFMQMKAAWFQAAGMTRWKDVPVAGIHRHLSFPCFP